MTQQIAAITLALGTVTSTAFSADIVDTAVENGSFKTLVTAVQSAGLVDTLKGEGPFTVFAPTDDAFAKLPEGTVESLLKPENKDQLAAILTYHVVPGRVPASEVVGLAGAVTVNGQRVDITTSEGVKVDGANVVATDVECSNGVIHVIDSVILPATDTIPAVATSAGQFNTLLTAVKSAGLAEVLGSDGPFTVFAPTDEAFAKLPEGTVESLLKPENKQKLMDILKYHVVAGRVYSEAALAAKHAETLQGGSIKIGVGGGKATVNDAGLVSTDIDASNGVIHVIDSVLLPEQNKGQAQAAPRHTLPSGHPIPHVTRTPVHVNRCRQHVHHMRTYHAAHPVSHVSRRCGR